MVLILKSVHNTHTKAGSGTKSYIDHMFCRNCIVKYLRKSIQIIFSVLNTF